jgi:hypothetical protein
MKILKPTAWHTHMDEVINLDIYKELRIFKASENNITSMKAVLIKYNA